MSVGLPHRVILGKLGMLVSEKQLEVANSAKFYIRIVIEMLILQGNAFQNVFLTLPFWKLLIIT